MHDYLDEGQRKAVEALREIKRICEKHGIRYFLIAGSCLGAVRHKGMIPWDDDVDLGFLQEDLKKLKGILPQELSPEFTYMALEVDPAFPRLFGKILYEGRSCVDLFLLAKWTNRNLPGFIHWRIRKFSVEGFKFSIRKSNPTTRPGEKFLGKVKRLCVRFVRRMAYIVLSPFVGPEWYVTMARRNEIHFESLTEDYSYINLYSVYSRHKERFEAQWLEGTPSLVEFEGEFYTTVTDTDAYLTHLYGDYMTPPPDKDRRKIHDVDFSK